jgi:alpha-beta hydrolase superfamily lysophospholipase
MIHNDGKFTAADGLNLYFQSWQPEGTARAVLAIVHGFGEHSGRYMNIINKMLPAGFAVYGFDHRGHGQSEGKRGYITRWAEFREDVRLFLQMIRNQEKNLPIIMLGHSMGGLIVLNYLLINQEENITAVVASSPLLAQPAISPVLVFISRILSRLWPGFSIDTGLDVNTISRDKEVVSAYLQDPLVHSMASARFGTELASVIEWTQAHTGDFKFPILIYHGKSDQLVPFQGSRDFYNNLKINDKRFNLYEQAYHETHNDIEKEIVLKDLQEWIEQHLAR